MMYSINPFSNDLPDKHILCSGGAYVNSGELQILMASEYEERFEYQQLEQSHEPPGLKYPGDSN